MRNNLACLEGYPTHLDVSDMSNLFCFYFVFTLGDDALTYRDPVLPARRDDCEYLCTNLN